jgi:hypothetical protein
MFWNYSKIHNLQKGEDTNPKKIEAVVKMLVPKTPQEIQVFNGMA